MNLVNFGKNCLGVLRGVLQRKVGTPIKFIEKENFLMTYIQQTLAHILPDHLSLRWKYSMSYKDILTHLIAYLMWSSYHMFSPSLVPKHINVVFLSNIFSKPCSFYSQAEDVSWLSLSMYLQKSGFLRERERERETERERVLHVLLSWEKGVYFVTVFLYGSNFVNILCWVFTRECALQDKRISSRVNH